MVRSISFLFLFSLSLLNANSQVNPFGLNLTPDGKIEFATSEPNYNGNMDDPVNVRCGAETRREDLRNVRYEFLTIVEVPDEKWVSPTNMDPSHRYDTTYTNPNVSDLPDTGFGYAPVFVWSNSSTQEVIPEANAATFRDEVVGSGLNDSLSAVLKHTLENHIRTFRGKYQPDEARYELYTELSCIDSVTEKEAVYDYLVDKLVFYNYRGNRLTSVMGYHWNSGIEFDSLRYDRSGNIVYFSRESIGSIRNEYYFDYNRDHQVTQVTHRYSSTGNSDEDSFQQQDEEVIRFGYDASGKVHSRSMPLGDGSWLTCTFGN